MVKNENWEDIRNEQGQKVTKVSKEIEFIMGQLVAALEADGTKAMSMMHAIVDREGNDTDYDLVTITVVVRNKRSNAAFIAMDAVMHAIMEQEGEVVEKVDDRRREEGREL